MFILAARRLVAISLTCALGASTTFASPEEPVSFKDLPEELRDRLVLVDVSQSGIVSDAEGNFEEGDDPAPSFWLKLDAGEHPINLSVHPLRHTLTYAAAVYALATGDTTVTAGELLDSGYLPYTEIGIDSRHTIDTLTYYAALDNWDLYLLRSPSWVTYVKSSCLSNWQWEMKVSDDATVQEQLWTRNPAFWVNPYTGSPMVRSEELGDIYYYTRGVNSAGSIYIGGPDTGPRRDSFPGINAPELVDYLRVDPAWRDSMLPAPPKPPAVVQVTLGAEPYQPEWQPGQKFTVAALPRFLQERIELAVVDPFPTVRFDGEEMKVERYDTVTRFRIRLDQQPNAISGNEDFSSHIHLAAQAHALATGDLNVTLQELVDAGWLPYLDLGLDPARGVDSNYEFSYMRGDLTPLELFKPRSPDWVVSIKSAILGRWWDSRVASEDFTKLTTNPNFWVNPYTGTPMKESDQPGDFSMRETSIATGLESWEMAVVRQLNWVESAAYHTVEQLSPGEPGPEFPEFSD